MRFKQYLKEGKDDKYWRSQGYEPYEFKDQKRAFKFTEFFTRKGSFPFGHVEIVQNTVLVPPAVINRMSVKDEKEMEALYGKLK